MIKDFEFLDLETDLLEQVENEQLSLEESDEIIEEASILIDKKGIMSIHSTPDPGRNLGEGGGYFKCVNHQDFNAASHIARIKFTSPEYITTHKDPKRLWYLSSGEKKVLMNLLTSPLTGKQISKIPSEFRPYVTNGWQYLIYNYNIDCGVDPQLMLKFINNINESVPTNLVRLTIPIPNYMTLTKK